MSWLLRFSSFSFFLFLVNLHLRCPFLLLFRVQDAAVAYRFVCSSMVCSGLTVSSGSSSSATVLLSSGGGAGMSVLPAVASGFLAGLMYLGTTRRSSTKKRVNEPCMRLNVARASW